jgi:hypothetical protein
MSGVVIVCPSAAVTKASITVATATDRKRRRTAVQTARKAMTILKLSQEDRVSRKSRNARSADRLANSTTKLHQIPPSPYLTSNNI